MQGKCFEPVQDKEPDTTAKDMQGTAGMFQKGKCAESEGDLWRRINGNAYFTAMNF